MTFAAGSNAPAPCSSTFSGWSKQDWQILLGLLLASLVAFLCGLNAFGLLDPSDGYYSEGAREMFESGNWLVPTLNYAWFFDKPVMNYWLIASCYKVFGVSEFASRLPAATCGALLVPAMFAFCRQFLNRRASILSAVALISSPMWLILGHMSLTDMPLTFFTWIALGCLFIALEKNKRNLVWFAYVSIGFGLLTKGPLALFLVGMNLGLYVLLKRPSLKDLWSIILRLHLIPGLMLSAVIAAPWYFLVNRETAGAFVQEFFLNQNINRAMGTVDHKAGMLYYLPPALGAGFPWTLLELIFAPLWFSPWLRFLKHVKTNEMPLFTCVTVFGVTAVLGMLVFFSVLPTKLVTYILPVVPAMALVAGITLDKIMRLAAPLKIPTLIAGVIVSLVSIAGTIIIAWSLVAPQSHLFGGKLGATIQIFLQASDAPIRIFLLASLVGLSAGAISLIVLSNSHKKVEAYKSFVILSVLSIIAAVPSSIVLGYQQKCRAMQSLVLYARAHYLSPIVLGHRNPSAVFYLGKKVTYLPGAEELDSFLRGQKSSDATSTGCFLVHQTVYRDLEKAGQKLCVLQQNGEWILGCKQ